MMQYELEQLKALKAFGDLFGYTREATKGAIAEIRESLDTLPEEIRETMAQRADELEEALEVVSEYVESH